MAIRPKFRLVVHIPAQDERPFRFNVNTFPVFPESLFTIPESVFTFDRNLSQRIVFQSV